MAKLPISFGCIEGGELLQKYIYIWAAYWNMFCSVLIVTTYNLGETVVCPLSYFKVPVIYLEAFLCASVDAS